MKFGDVDITLMSVSEAIHYFTGTYHDQIKAILRTNKLQLSLGMENRSLRNTIKPILDHFLAIEDKIYAHIKQENDILNSYLNDKNLSAEFAGISMYAIIKEHDSVLKMLEKLRGLCNNYICKDTDHVTLKLCFAKLNNFEQDLRRNIYFENNIFFPKILKHSLSIK